MEQLSLSTTTTERVLQSPEATTTEPSHPRACIPQQEKPPQREDHAPQPERSPHSPQLEKSNEGPAQPQINQ